MIFFITDPDNTKYPFVFYYQEEYDYEWWA